MISGGITATGMIDGENGYSNAVVQLFRRYAPTQAAPTPALPTGTLTYTFSTGVLSGATASFNGWSQQIPAATAGTKLFVTQATASSQDATCDIATSEWSTPVEYVTDGMSTQYQRRYKSTNSSTPPDVTQDSPSTWSETPTAISSAARYRYVSQRSSDDNGATWSAWSAAVIDGYFSQDGTSISIQGTAIGVIDWGEPNPSGSGTSGDIYLKNNKVNDADTSDYVQYQGVAQGVYAWVGKTSSMGDGFLIDGYLWMKVRETPAYARPRWKKMGLIQGPPGDDAVQYSIQCSPESVNFRSNAAGEFSGSVTVSAVIKKTVGNELPTDISSGTEGVYLYSKKNTDSSYAANSSITVTAGQAVAAVGPVTSLTFILSSSSTVVGIASNNILFTKTIAVVCDGRRGVAGATGKMFYPMGTWNPTTTYTRTGIFIPLVWVDDRNSYNAAIDAYGNYWYLTAESDTGHKPQDGSDYWAKADSFGLVITQGIFAEFAKLSKAIMSGDYMFSMNGRVDGVNYNAGSNWKDRPAYTLFGGNPALSVPHITDATKNLGTSYTALNDFIDMSQGDIIVMKLVVTQATTTMQVGMFSVTGGDPQTIEYSTSDANTSWTTATVIEITQGNTYYIRFAASMTYAYNLRARKTYGTADLKYSLTRVMFSPNLYMDLFTGDSYMRNVTMKNGYFSGLQRTMPTIIQCGSDTNIGQYLKKGWLAKGNGSFVIGSDNNSPALKRFDLMRLGASIVFLGSGGITDESGNEVLMHLPFIWSCDNGDNFDYFINLCADNVNPAFPDFSKAGPNASKRERMRVRSFLGCELEILNLSGGTLNLCGLLCDIQEYGSNSVWNLYGLPSGRMIRLTCMRYNFAGASSSYEGAAIGERIAWKVTTVVKDWFDGGGQGYAPYFDERFVERMDYAE